MSVTPAAAQAYLETLTFTRANGMTVTDSLSAFGIALAQSPSITAQPLSQTITAGQDSDLLGHRSRHCSAELSVAEERHRHQRRDLFELHDPGGNNCRQCRAVHRRRDQLRRRVTSNAAILTVNPAPVAPSITTQPLSQTITAGQTATFSVTAAGTAPLSYQWQKNGAAIERRDVFQLHNPG